VAATEYTASHEGHVTRMPPASVVNTSATISLHLSHCAFIYSVRLASAGLDVTPAHPRQRVTSSFLRPSLIFIYSVRLASAGLDVTPAHPRQRVTSSFLRPPLIFTASRS